MPVCRYNQTDKNNTYTLDKQGQDLKGTAIVEDKPRIEEGTEGDTFESGAGSLLGGDADDYAALLAWARAERVGASLALMGACDDDEAALVATRWAQRTYGEGTREAHRAYSKLMRLWREVVDPAAAVAGRVVGSMKDRCVCVHVRMWNPCANGGTAMPKPKLKVITRTGPRDTSVDWLDRWNDLFPSVMSTDDPRFRPVPRPDFLGGEPVDDDEEPSKERMR